MGVLKSKNIDYTGTVPVDTSLSTVSTSAVQNKIVTNTITDVIEVGDYATTAHYTGNVFLWKNKLVKATADISTNAQIIPSPETGANVEDTNIVDTLNMLNNNLTVQDISSQLDFTNTAISNYGSGAIVKVFKYGKLIQVVCRELRFASTGTNKFICKGLPVCSTYAITMADNIGVVRGSFFLEPSSTSLYAHVTDNSWPLYGVLIYFTA